MLSTTRTPVSRSPGAPAGYLARPATRWLTAVGRPHPGRARAGQHLRPGTEAGQ